MENEEEVGGVVFFLGVAVLDDGVVVVFDDGVVVVFDGVVAVVVVNASEEERWMWGRPLEEVFSGGLLKGRKNKH